MSVLTLTMCLLVLKSLIFESVRNIKFFFYKPYHLCILYFDSHFLYSFLIHRHSLSTVNVFSSKPEFSVVIIFNRMVNKKFSYLSPLADVPKMVSKQALIVPHAKIKS